ncbi:MAG TPA: adenylyl-sulfate kinase [Planctomycetota bacterium]|nr:adenylyl-sulfate kinase [Planctomycetota bacterium]
MSSSAASVEQMKIVIVGHVDHGKSTFVGRLFYDTGSLPTGKYEQLVKIAERRGVPFEWANLMDSLQSERDQNITIDTAQIWFKTPRRQYVIIDAPGHKEFLKNMITGAASADAALLLIDAHEGVQEQSRRHGYMLHLLGIRQVIVLVNKMDLVGYDQAVFDRIEREYRAFLAQLGVEPKLFIPIAAKHGDNIAKNSENTRWFKDKYVVSAIDNLFELGSAPIDQPLRFPIQDIYRFDHRRILAGRVESGTLKVGDKLVFTPRGKTGIVKTIERWSAPASNVAYAGESIGVTLTEQIFVERGHVGSHEQDAPITAAQFQANLFWLGKQPMEIGKKYKIKLTTQEVECEIASIEKIIDASTLQEAARDRKHVAKNDVAELTLKTKYPIGLDNHNRIAETGRFVIVDNKEVCGGGIILHGKYADQPAKQRSSNVTWHKTKISADDRASRNGHKGAVIWLTGYSGAGKSTIATELENELFHHQINTYVLDGDNVRHGLCGDLGFTPQDRTENIRRIGEVAHLMADAGLLVITTFISPYKDDREKVRKIVTGGDKDFVEVYVKCPLDVCEKRDPKGLYKKARAGEIKDFTGISAPYEEPAKPEIVLETDKASVAECVTRLMDHLRELIYVEKHG